MNQSMLLPLMMMGSGSGSGSTDGNSEAGPSTDLMMRMLMPDLFEEDVTPIWSTGQIIGTARGSKDGDVGVVSLRLMPPTMVSSKASLRLSTSGQILCKPSELKAVGEFLIAAADSYVESDELDEEGNLPEHKTLRQAYAEAVAREDDLAPQRTAYQMAKVVSQ